MMWGRTVKGLRMACVAEKAVFPKHEAIEVRILIENVGQQEEVVLSERRPYLDYEVTVMQAESHTPAPLTDAGRDLRESKTLREMASRKLVEISRAEPYSFPYPLHEFFDLSRVGDYVVTVSRPEWRDADGPLTSLPLQFRVI